MNTTKSRTTIFQTLQYQNLPSQESLETQNLSGGENSNLSIQQCDSNTRSDAVNIETTPNFVTQSDTIERNARANADDRNSVSSQSLGGSEKYTWPLLLICIVDKSLWKTCQVSFRLFIYVI